LFCFLSRPVLFRGNLGPFVSLLLPFVAISSYGKFTQEPTAMKPHRSVFESVYNIS